MPLMSRMPESPGKSAPRCGWAGWSRDRRWAAGPTDGLVDLDAAEFLASRRRPAARHARGRSDHEVEPTAGTASRGIWKASELQKMLADRDRSSARERW